MDIRHMKQKVLNYETISYFVIGVLTTLVDYAVFALVNELLKGRGMAVSASSAAATVVAWIAAVLFAFITNKLIVFRSYGFRPSVLIRECTGFFAARGLSGLITLALMYLMTGLCGWNEYLAKIITSVFNLVFNYAASKLYIFKK